MVLVFYSVLEIFIQKMTQTLQYACDFPINFHRKAASYKKIYSTVVTSSRTSNHLSCMHLELHRIVYLHLIDRE